MQMTDSLLRVLRAFIREAWVRFGCGDGPAGLWPLKRDDFGGSGLPSLPILPGLWLQTLRI